MVQRGVIGSVPRASVSYDSTVRLALFGLFWAGYAALGLMIAATGAIGEIDFFDADSVPFIGGVTETDAKGPRTETHPVFPLLFRPVGIALRGVLGSSVRTAVLLTSLGGAMSVTMAHVFFRLAGVAPLAALIWSGVLGLSFAHLVFSAIPDTFIFSAASMILLFVVFFKPRGKLRQGVVVTVVSCGILVTNVVHGVIGVVTRAGWRPLVALRRLAWFLCLVAAGVIVLNQAQKLVYPEVSDRFLEMPYERELRWVFLPRTTADGLYRAKVLIQHVFIYSLVAPKLEVRPPSRPPRMPRVSMHTPVVRFHAIGVAANALWLGLIAAGGWGLLRNRFWRAPEVVALALSLLFNVTIHYFYGRELFLYSATWTFPLVALVGVALARSHPPDGWAARVYAGGAILFVILAGVNNGLVLRDLVLDVPRWMP